MTYRAFRYSGIFFWLLKTGFVLKNTKSGWKSGLKNTIVNAINLPFFSFSTHVKGLESAARSCCLLCSVFSFLPFITEGFASFARPRCTLWTVAVSILLQQETQQLLANATLKLNQRPFLKLNRKLLWKAVKICEIELHRNSTNTFVCVSAWPYTLWLVSSS